MSKPPRRSVARCYRCNGKLAFQSRGDAQRFIRNAQPHDPTFTTTNLAAYRCPHGLGFHVGHSLDGQPFEKE